MRSFGAVALVLSALLGARAAHADDGGQRFTLSWDGHARSYLLYAPPNAGGKLPLVVALHGASQDAAAASDGLVYADAVRHLFGLGEEERR